MKYILPILLSLNMFNPFNSPVNNRGGTLTEFSYNYVYFVDYYESTQVADSGVYSIERDYPSYYGIKVNIVFKQPIKSARLQLTLSSPNSGYSVTWDVIGENCYVTKSTNTRYYVDCYNCTNATFVMLGSYQFVKDTYSYNRVSFESILLANNTWIDYGGSYVDIVGLQVSSNYVVDTNPDYTSQLNTLLSQTDGIENYLLQIWNQSITNGNTINSISTSLVSVNNYLQSINNKLDSLNNIEWNNIDTTYTGYTTDFQTYDLTLGTKSPGYFVYNSFNVYTANTGLYRIEIPIGNALIRFENLKFYTYYNNTIEGHEITFDEYIYFRNRSSIVLYFVVNENYNPWPNGNNPLVIQVMQSVYLYSTTNYKMQYILQDDINYWTVYNTMKQISSLNDINTSLSQIISILGTTDISSTDNQNKQTVDNKLNQLIQNLTLPEIPNKPSKLPFIQHLFQVYGEIINIPGLDIFKWFMGMQAIVMLLGVILK